MRILLSNHSLFRLGGSETWVKTMFDELTRRGHEVHVYTPIHQLYPEIPPWTSSGRYDLGILNHNNCLTFLRTQNVDKIIFTSHGVIPQPEWPVEGADVYVGVSEEVVEDMKIRWDVDGIVIRNPIDTEKFRPTKALSPSLQKVLFLSNYGWTVKEVLEVATKDYDFLWVGGEDRREEVERWLNWADLVVGLGRSVYEAMSCGRNVVVYDYQGGDGFVTPESILEFRKRNCSGRTNHIKYTADEFHDELEKYDPVQAGRLRDYVLHENNVRLIVDQYLSL